MLKMTYNAKRAESVWWNIFLITLGSAIYALGIQAVAVPNGFVTGGVMGVAMLVWYGTDLLTVPTWYFAISIPIFVAGWFLVGRVFLLYSFYAAVCTTLWGYAFTFTIPLDQELYAAVLAGVLCGAGGGIMLRSLGSGGGTDILAVALRERWNISVGLSSFYFNICVFTAAALRVDLDLVIASTIMLFINTTVLEYVLRLFNQRKMVMIISEHGEQLCEAIMLSQQFGITFMRAKGAYSGNDKEVLVTVTNNMHLKELENIVFGIDEHALFIVENTFYVSGGQFARKVYK